MRFLIGPLKRVQRNPSRNVRTALSDTAAEDRPVMQIRAVVLVVLDGYDFVIVHTACLCP